MIFESELRVLNLLWENGECTASQLAGWLNVSVGWKKTTTYTIIKRCIAKGYVRRLDQDFICVPVITLEEARQSAIEDLADRMFNGSPDLMTATLLGRKSLTKKQVVDLQKLVETFSEDVNEKAT